MGLFSKFFGSHEDEPNKELVGFTSENEEALDELCDTLHNAHDTMPEDEDEQENEQPRGFFSRLFG